MADVESNAKTWTPDQLTFQAWLALPAAARDPKQQRQLAGMLEVHETTLSDWKRLPGWHDAVYELAMRHVVSDLVPVLYAQVREAKRGSLPHAQWLFEIAGKWTPKQKIEQSTTTAMVVEVKARDYRQALTPFLPPAEAFLPPSEEEKP